MYCRRLIGGNHVGASALVVIWLKRFDHFARLFQCEGEGILLVDEVRRIIRAARVDARDSLETVDRLNAVVREETGRITLQFEDGMSAWPQDFGRPPGGWSEAEVHL